MKFEFKNNSDMSDWIAMPLALAFLLLFLAWFTILPAIGVLYLFGWLK